MVKNTFKIFSIIFVLGTFCFLFGCNIDLLGLFTSNDLDERLKDRNNLFFLDSNNWTSPSLGDEFAFIVLADTHIEDGKAWGLEKLSGVITANNAISANIKIEFAVIASDQVGEIGKGTHTRFVIDAERFMQKVQGRM